MGVRLAKQSASNIIQPSLFQTEIPEIYMVLLSAVIVLSGSRKLDFNTVMSRLSIKERPTLRALSYHFIVLGWCIAYS